MSRKKSKAKQKPGGKPKSIKKRARAPKLPGPAITLIKSVGNSSPLLFLLAKTSPLLWITKYNTRASKNKSPQVEETQPGSSCDPRSRIKAFFAGYPSFRYSPYRPVMEEFYCLCDTTWPNRRDRERDIAWRGFRDALTQQFNDIYGTDEQCLTNWESLCVVLQLRDIPKELDACRELVRSTHVNIIDLIDTSVTGDKVQHFESEWQLSEYTRNTRKYFPKKNAYAGGLLKSLLQHITSPRNGEIHSRQRGGTQR
ncbi:hypothetical protein FRC12_016950 [Ceratobasidium sp. 428]|nr:hypothetical protein FRC12_016950 [Ceratobasidium sp. 428]